MLPNYNVIVAVRQHAISSHEIDVRATKSTLKVIMLRERRLVLPQGRDPSEAFH